jgi:hypothetical protein
MKILLLLILIIYTFSINKNYYKSCNAGAPKSGFITYSECQGYAAPEAYCCLMYYVANPNVELNLIFKKKENNTSVGKIDEQEGRKLSERENLCIGLSSEGYHHIKEVIKELEKESGLEDISINCVSKTLNISILLFILFLNLF